MVIARGEVVRNPNPPPPFKVVFKHNGTVIGEWGVNSEAEGEAQIIEGLKRLAKETGAAGDST